ncbi:stage III sporulation protein AH [Salirhabdus euzebyi]|uniref:Stage III sporulation protein AH n=1 Tax=Salirhabdus euzebyi TaxID=394506 RepID=A0A841Q744_9BACI|nr:SpoIIIAH-like family protein [Salirhabdus euzebyi]MBB6454226.1 stage III sporulation protein AH [Salirhabdus euzebyi]
MMLKKQTVWLLTMLSLLIVLSVYYMTSPGGEQVAFIDDQNNDESEEMDTGDTIETNVNEGATDGVETDENGNVSSGISSDQVFTAIRMDIQDERSRKKEQLEDIVASSSVSSEEKNQAMEEMARLEELKTKEAILEKVIQTEKNYEDVLVRAEDDMIHVTVKASEVSETDTVHIMQMVRDEFGDIPANVKFQPSE